MNGVEILEGVPQAIVRGAEEGANRIAEVATMASDRVAKGAGQAAKGAGQAAKGAGQAAKGAGQAAKGAGQVVAKRNGTHIELPRRDARLRARLDRTSRELAHESSDLNAAIASLNKFVRTTRRRRGRTRLLFGTVLGAALMYHFDAEHGRERREATARLLTDMVKRAPAASAH